MPGQAIITVSAAVVGLTQLLKMLFNIQREDVRAALVLGVSVLGVGVWVWSQNTYNRASSFDIFAGWIAVSTSAAGVFGMVINGQNVVNNVRSTFTPDPVPHDNQP